MAYSPCSSTYSVTRQTCGQGHIAEWPPESSKYVVKVKAKSGRECSIRFCAVNKIGRGGFGQVYVGHRWATEFGGCLSHEQMAIKILQSPSSNDGSQERESVEQRIQKEWNVHKLLEGNRHVVTPFTSVKFPDTSTGNTVYLLAMEYCTKGDLSQYLAASKVVVESLAKRILEQVLNGLLSLHVKGYFHRDIKASNIFITADDVFKIGDFGLVADSRERNTIICGTPNAMAPEVDGITPYGPEVDVWSLGILLFTLLFGHHPFQGQTSEETVSNARYLGLKFPQVPQLSLEVKELLIRMLAKEPRKRIRAEDILRHGYFACSNNRTQCSDSGIMTSNLSGSTTTAKPPPLMEPLVSQMSMGSRMPSSINGRQAVSKCVTLCSPLSTERLRPSSKTHQFKVGCGLIQSDGTVHMEFNVQKKVVQNGTNSVITVVEHFDVTNDGRTVDVRKGESHSTYSYECLPSKYWSKYNYAAKFVAIVKEQTPKVTYYSELAVCRLMENGPSANCEVVFYGPSGPKFYYVANKDIRVVRGGQTEYFSNKTLSLDTDSPLHKEWRHFRTLHQRVKLLETSMEQMQVDEAKKNEAKVAMFPLTIGKRPASLSGQWSR